MPRPHITFLVARGRCCAVDQVLRSGWPGEIYNFVSRHPANNLEAVRELLRILDLPGRLDKTEWALSRVALQMLYVQPGDQTPPSSRNLFPVAGEQVPPDRNVTKKRNTRGWL